MSEFSDSYHLRGAKQKDGSALLARANIRGFVFPESNGWVTVLPEGTPFEPNEDLISANTGILLHFVNAEDHGWGFELYRGSEEVSRYMATWEDEIAFERGFDLETLESLLGPVISPAGPERVRQIFEPKGIEELLATHPAAAFAQAVGLKHYEWLSFEYLFTDRSRGEAIPNGVEFLGQ